jgi:hypothetical protein
VLPRLSLLIRRGIFLPKWLTRVLQTVLESYYGNKAGSWKGTQMEQQWENDDEVVTTFRTIKMSQQENYDAGFAAGVAWAEAQVKAGA